MFIFLFVIIKALSQDIPDDDTTSRPAITKAGKPTGRLVQKMMNKDGSTLVSANRIAENIREMASVKVKAKSLTL